MTDSSTHNSQYQHGGNLSWVRKHFPQAPMPLIDLSTCINPYGYPLPQAQAQWHYELADVALMQQAFKALSSYFSLPSENHIALGSGMQPLMVALAALRLKNHGIANVAIFAPTYTEHERIWSQLGHRCMPYADGINADVVIICNPNNPDGRVVPPETLLKLAQSGVWLIVDESFADVQQNCSIAYAAPQRRNIIVLRSFGKFFGLAGLRVSAAIACKPLIESLRVLVGPWPISTLACHMLPLWLYDTAWINDMRHKLHNEAQAWRGVLGQYFKIVGTTDLFVLVETANVEGWFHHLASQGILVRKFDYNARWLRFGLPHAQHASRLAKAFADGPKP
jgi:cobalamin biosynthetic protein CobC